MLCLIQLLTNFGILNMTDHNIRVRYFSVIFTSNICCSVYNKANYAVGDVRRNIFMLHDMCAGTHSAQDVRKNTFMLLEMCAEAYLCFSRCAQKHTYGLRIRVVVQMLQKLNTSSGKRL